MGTLATMGKDEYVAMSVLDRICNELNCDINEVIEHKKNDNIFLLQVSQSMVESLCT